MDEETARARANLGRHVAEPLARRERLLAAGGNHGEALPAAIQELFGPDAWWAAVLEWQRERGKSMEGWAVEGKDCSDSVTDAG